MTENHLIKPHRWWYSKTGLALLAFAAIAAFSVTEHRALVRVGSSSNESTRRAP